MDNVQKHNICTTECKQTEEEHSVLPTEVHSISPTQTILFLSFLVFPLFCPPPCNLTY
jgi:hypothetical protein